VGRKGFCQKKRADRGANVKRGKYRKKKKKRELSLKEFSGLAYMGKHRCAQSDTQKKKIGKAL